MNRDNLRSSSFHSFTLLLLKNWEFESFTRWVFVLLSLSLERFLKKQQLNLKDESNPGLCICKKHCQYIWGWLSVHTSCLFLVLKIKLSILLVNHLIDLKNTCVFNCWMSCTHYNRNTLFWLEKAHYLRYFSVSEQLIIKWYRNKIISKTKILGQTAKCDLCSDNGFCSTHIAAVLLSAGARRHFWRKSGDFAL